MEMPKSNSRTTRKEFLFQLLTNDWQEILSLPNDEGVWCRL